MEYKVTLKVLKSNTLNDMHGISILFKHLIIVINQIFCSKLYISHPKFWVNYSTWCIKWGFWLYCRDYQRACVVHQIGWNKSPSICTIFLQKLASMLPNTGYKTPTPLNLLNFYWLKSRAKRQSSTETVAPAECISCRGEKRDLSKMSKKLKQSHKLRAPGKYHTSF